MTEQRVCANGSGLPKTRAQLQSDALAIECLIGAINGLYASSDPEHDLIVLTEIGLRRAKALTDALDSIHKPEVSS
ncbi:hypothetical protein [Ruegeria atlantica]|uniref:hypothetical protein n=1 Tax=Ruegeria atlantica TaxID=81569 RepID=UPI0014802DD4|nr:hypothetical protein [Ruegeria atlantica]